MIGLARWATSLSGLRSKMNVDGKESRVGYFNDYIVPLPVPLSLRSATLRMSTSNSQVVNNGRNRQDDGPCPACGHRGYPIIVATSSPSVST